MNPDFQDMLSCLNAEGAEYLLVGGYALAVHGVPRATGDLDIWVKPSPQNAEKVFRALAAFGAPLKGLSKADFSCEGISFQIGIAPRKIDIITSISGVTFQDAWKSRLIKNIAGTTANIISIKDFKKNKLAAGRPKDLADVSMLETESARRAPARKPPRKQRRQ